MRLFLDYFVHWYWISSFSCGLIGITWSNYEAKNQHRKIGKKETYNRADAGDLNNVLIILPWTKTLRATLNSFLATFQPSCCQNRSNRTSELSFDIHILFILQNTKSKFIFSFDIHILFTFQNTKSKFIFSFDIHILFIFENTQS